MLSKTEWDLDTKKKEKVLTLHDDTEKKTWTTNQFVCALWMGKRNSFFSVVWVQLKNKGQKMDRKTRRHCARQTDRQIIVHMVLWPCTPRPGDTMGWRRGTLMSPPAAGCWWSFEFQFAYRSCDEIWGSISTVSWALGFWDLCVLFFLQLLCTPFQLQCCPWCG